MPEERDQLFEKALARHLRADGEGESLCLDPETLAAYHERVLSPEEMAAAKTHIASCSRCQEILVELETTEDVSSLLEQPAVEPVKIAVGTAQVEEEDFDGPRGLPDASPRIPAAAPTKVVAISSRRRTLLWAVPAGAIAASLLLWMGIERGGKSEVPAAKSVQVAENRSAQPAQEESSQPLNAVPAGGASAPVLKQKEISKTAPPPKLELRDADRKKDATEADKALALPKPATRQDFSRMRNTQPQPGPSAANSQNQAADALQQSAPGAVAGQMSEMVVVTPAAPQLDSAGAPVPSGKAAVGGAAGAKPAAAAPTAPPPPPPVPASAANAQSEIVARNQAINGRDYSSLSPVLSKTGLDIRIAAPDGKKVWNVGPSGQIAFSKDGGRSWSVQSSGVSANLTNGSAPSDKVCWIAGAAGTLLRTTDGGKTWQNVRTPFAGDLGGVHATDAQHAAIWDATNAARYETSDGGATWKRSANE